MDFPQQGELGEVIGNPYDIAPLTAVIKNGGVVLTKAHVRVVPKKGGVEIAYDVGPTTLRTYGGIPVFGLYPEYLNTVEVTWTKREGGKLTEKAETYRIWTPPVYLDPAWTKGRPVKTFETEIIKPASKEFADRLYLCNNLMGSSPRASALFGTILQAVHWNGILIRRTPFSIRRERCVGSCSRKRFTIREAFIGQDS